MMRPAAHRRPSYLQHLAARTHASVGMAVVAPPRLLFRADGGSAALEANTPPGSGIADSDRLVVRRSTPPPGKTAAATAQAEIASAASGRPPVALAAPATSRQSSVSHRMEVRDSHGSSPTQPASAARAKAGPTRLAASAMYAPRMPIASAPPPPGAATPPQMARQPALAESRQNLAIRELRASLDDVAAAAGIGPPRVAESTPADHTSRSFSVHSSVPSRDVEPADAMIAGPPPAAPHERSLRAHHLELPSLLPQAGGPPPRTKTEPHLPGLHIGTLEVRLSMPPAPPRQAGAPRAPAARSTAGTARRIARAFGVFGLGQS